MTRTQVLGSVLLVALCSPLHAEKPIAIGSRRELLVDRHLIAKFTGTAKLQLHKPKAQEVVLVTDKPWEGNTCAYYTIFQDGKRYRMYYRGSHYDTKKRRSAHREVVCYAESKDGIHWTKPELNLFSFDGSKKNNIVWDGIGGHTFAAFKDDNPACKPEARYKAIARGKYKKRSALFAFQSPDGIHWKLMSDKPVITRGAFDSQNLAFWDAHRKEYREYHRTFVGGVRAIMTGTSRDFLHWTDPVLLRYTGAAKEHLYTNAIRPYFRAPHLFLGFPTRFFPKRGQQVEPTFMTSRDGLNFHRWPDALIPVTAPKDRDGNRSNYMTWGLVQLPQHPKELSVYATEAYYTGPDSRVRRFTYRVDGFVSAQARGTGEVLTKPLTFTGNQLELNLVTLAGGSVRVELQDEKGNALKGFSLKDCKPMTGDALDQVVQWKGGSQVKPLAGKPVRLRFQLTDADLYAFRFAP